MLLIRICNEPEEGPGGRLIRPPLARTGQPQGLILLILAPFREASPIRPFSPKTKTYTGLCRVSTS